MGAGASSNDEGTNAVGQNESTNDFQSKQKLNPKIIEPGKGTALTDDEELSSDGLGTNEDAKVGGVAKSEEDIAYEEIKHWNYDQKVKRFALYIIFGQFDKVSCFQLSKYSIMKCNS